MARNNNRNQSGRHNNNTHGHNQYTNQWTETARDKPFTTAAAAAAAVGAGVFLWSRRNQISDQISNLSGQLSDWADELRSGSSSRELAMTEGHNESSAIESSRKTASRGSSGSSRSTSASRTTGKRNTGSTARSGRSGGMSETGGGNASLGAHSGTTGGGGTIGGGPRG